MISRDPLDVTPFGCNSEKLSGKTGLHPTDPTASHVVEGGFNHVEADRPDRTARVNRGARTTYFVWCLPVCGESPPRFFDPADTTLDA